MQILGKTSKATLKLKRCTGRPETTDSISGVTCKKRYKNVSTIFLYPFPPRSTSISEFIIDTRAFSIPIQINR